VVDEKGLFQSVCNILVRSGSFQLAWFGYADENSGRVSEPIAWSGDGGFLEDLKIALRQDDYEDPASVCLRSGDASWIRNLDAHTLGPIRPALLRCGYTSVISVPVTSQENGHGALTLYYDDPDRYGQGVVSVLKEQIPHVQAVYARRSPSSRPRSEELETEIRNLIDVLPITLALLDGNGQILYLNRAVVDYLGFSVAEHESGDAQRKYLHPDDYERIFVEIGAGYARGLPFEYEVRQRGKDQQYHWFLVNVTPIRDEGGQIIRWCFTGMDIEERKRAAEKLHQSQADLLEAQKISHTGSWKFDLTSGIWTITPEMARIFGLSEGECSMTREFFFSRLHPEGRTGQAITYERARKAKADFENDYRILLPDGSVRHVHEIGHPKLDEGGDLVEFVGTVIDVTAEKQAEEKIRQSESELRQILDFAPQHVYVLGADPGATRFYANQAALDYFGLTYEEWRTSDLREIFHPDDWVRANSGTESQVAEGLPHEVEIRLRGKDGTYRWFLFRRSPLRDEQGRLTRWYIAATDINDRRIAEQRLQDENIALRDEVDRASMFEEIVGTSEPLKKVVSRIFRVAQTDSGVLITGETGTGKELVARAIHRLSGRSRYPFVSVNCAAIPRDLIASELFGHEKGAFTGAAQRRTGRFELAAGGTIFLDEVGDLPAETQVALLRVLQEREFERVGGSTSIQTDVRVLAATNLDLEGAIAAGTFRSDLFYRLNVFPIEMPSLRERHEDIPLLVEYFLERYARKAGKTFKTVDRKSLDLLQSYPWPGNIRELQNVIERSVIVSETETFSVDKSWLSRQPRAQPRHSHPELSRRPAAMEKTIIEAALRECRGRVAGMSGAAAKLGIPGSTLESKIKSLKIDKNRFRTTP
jgi:PAS domain S-box-containing protein